MLEKKGNRAYEQHVVCAGMMRHLLLLLETLLTGFLALLHLSRQQTLSLVTFKSFLLAEI